MTFTCVCTVVAVVMNTVDVFAPVGFTVTEVDDDLDDEVGTGATTAVVDFGVNTKLAIPDAVALRAPALLCATDSAPEYNAGWSFQNWSAFKFT